jgi:hypothetical protein
VNCTYSGLNTIGQPTAAKVLGLKHELTEIALVHPPPDLAGVGITVIDGPFMSTLPFPPGDLHSLTHVRFTPHASWEETGVNDPDPSDVLHTVHVVSRFDRMRRDAERYVPCLAEAQYVRSIYEVKTVPASSELDDGRPIIFQTFARPKMASVLGSKMDNIYDVLPSLERFLGT